MIRRLIILLLIVGCVTEPEDCAGVAGGTAVEDACSVCKGDGYNSENYYCSDLEILQEFIDNSQNGTNFIPPANLLPTDETVLWEQTWENGRLTSLISCCNCAYFINICNKGLCLKGEIPTEIGNLNNLTQLRLDGNRLEGEIPVSISKLINLEYLQLNCNRLSGEIPLDIGNLTNLTYLYLNNNQLTGEIPSEIGNLTNLTILRLNRNELTGSIPTDIGNLTHLTYLSLSSNQLTGEIPVEIGNLTNLTYLSLSYNQLTGEIPSAVCDLIESNNLVMSSITAGNNLINTCE